MLRKGILRLHWKLFFPLIGLLWLIIGITIVYFVTHEKERQRENLENRLLNVNNTVIDAYEQGLDLNETVAFIHLFTDNTTLDPLRITVYDDRTGEMLADNPARTILLSEISTHTGGDYTEIIRENRHPVFRDVNVGQERSMISSKLSPDGHVRTYAALPYKGEVLAFISFDPMVWMVIIMLGVVMSVLVYFGVRAVCRNVYVLRDFAEAMASDRAPEDVDKLHFSSDELGEVSRMLLTLYREKITAEQEKILHERQIAMSVSHELKTPVGIIKGYLDTVLDTPDMPEEVKHHFLVRAQQTTDRMTSLINDLSQVLRLHDRSNVDGVTDIDFHKLTTQLAEDVEQGHISGEMELVCNIPEDCRITGHESLLTNALLNLVYNAARHSGGTRMELKWLGRKDGFHIFSFADNGTGVSPEHLSRLFDLFYRVDGGRARKSGGMGLGLPLVRRTISLMGGEIDVQNRPEGGLEFIFTLPAVS